MCRPRQKPLSCHFQLVGQEDCPRWSKTQMSSQMKRQQKRLTLFNHLMRAKVAGHVDERRQTPRCQPLQSLHRRRGWVRDKSRNIAVIFFPEQAVPVGHPMILYLSKRSLTWKAFHEQGRRWGRAWTRFAALEACSVEKTVQLRSSGFYVCIDLEFWGSKDALPDMVLDWEGCRCGDRSHISMHLKEDSFQVCCCQHHVLFYLIRQALWHLWEEWQPFEKLPAVGSGFEHLPVLSGLEEPDRHKVAACTCNWREPVFSGGSRWWRCRSRWSRRLPPRRGRAGTWRYFRTFSSSASLPEDPSISQSEIDIGV